MAVDLPSLDAPDSDAASPRVAGATKPQALGRAVGRGFSWLTLSFLTGKCLSFVAQIVLGILLAKEEFGIFAIASSIATFAKVFHDGGLAQLLIQRGPEQFRSLAGPGFWIGICFSTAAGGLLAIGAPAAAHFYGDPKLAALLWVIAISLPLGAPAQVTRAKLRLDLRFRALTIISIGSVAIRHLGSIALAYQGFGAMSFVLPLLGVALFEDVAMFAATREKLWRERPNVSIWPELLRSSLWVVAALFFSAFLLFGDYLVLGLYLSKGALGQYYFGYQLTTQISSLVAVNLQLVLLPVLSRLAGDVVRQAAALVRTFRALVLVVAPLSLALTVIIEPLEYLVWHQKWAGVVPLMQVFAIAAPLRLFSTILHAVLTSRGRFRIVAWLTLLEGIVLMTTAWLAVKLVGSNLTGIAIIIASSQVLFNLILGSVLMHHWGVKVREFFRALLPGWGVAVIAAGVTLGISPLFINEAHRIVMIVANLAIFSGIYLLAMRTCCSSHFAELLAIMPQTVAEPMRRCLWLKPQPRRDVRL